MGLGGASASGHKRHLLVDTLGLLIVVAVTAANLDDGTAAPKLLSRVTVEELPRLKVIFGDNKYRNHIVERMAEIKSTAVDHRSAVATCRNERLHCGSQTMGCRTNQWLA